MNIISSLLNWIGNTIGANPSTLATTSKTLVGAINEVRLNTGTYVYAGNLTATNITATSTDTKVPIGSPVYISDNCFSYDSTNKILKCEKAGLYIVSATVDFTNVTNGDLMGFAIKQNSADLGYMYTRVSGSYDRTFFPAQPVGFQVGDTVTIYARNNTAGRGTCNSGKISITRLR